VAWDARSNSLTVLSRKARRGVVPGEAFGTNDHVPVYATSMHELERGLDPSTSSSNRWVSNAYRSGWPKDFH